MLIPTRRSINASTDQTLNHSRHDPSINLPDTTQIYLSIASINQSPLLAENEHLNVRLVFKTRDFIFIDPPPRSPQRAACQMRRISYTETGPRSTGRSRGRDSRRRTSTSSASAASLRGAQRFGCESRWSYATLPKAPVGRMPRFPRPPLGHRFAAPQGGLPRSLAPCPHFSFIPFFSDMPCSFHRGMDTKTRVPAPKHVIWHEHTVRRFPTVASEI